MRYKEARRYIANAKEILREKAGRENGQYSDRKYVKMAGNTAWNGVLEAAITWLENKGVRASDDFRPDVRFYIREISKRNQKMNKHFVNAYDILRKSLGYDGALKATISKEGLAEAEALIALFEKDI